nr:MAG TPA: Protein C [Inoviridae sp.]
MYGENGQLTEYLQLSPFVDGNFYAATFETRFLSYRGSYYIGPSTDSSTYTTHPQVWGCPVNYPDWWRADLPLGRNSYVQVDKLTFIPTGSSSLFSDLPSVCFLPQNKAYSFDITADEVVNKQKSPDPDVHLSSLFPFYLIYTYSQATNNDVKDSFVGGDLLTLGRKSVSFNSSSPVTFLLSDDQCVLTLNQNNLHYSYYLIDSMANASLSQIEWLVMPDIRTFSDDQLLQLNNKILKVSAEISFWIDANKLPPGLDIGDVFPAPAADPLGDLQKKLLEDYNIQERISETESYLDESIRGFNSVDSSVADSSSSFLSSLYSAFNFILLPVLILLVGAGLLRIVLRKAVS